MKAVLFAKTWFRFCDSDLIFAAAACNMGNQINWLLLVLRLVGK